MSKKWTLLHGEASKENVAAALDETYHRITGATVMVYTTRRYSGFQEASDAFLTALSEDEKNWLLDCIAEGVRGQAKRYAKQARQNDHDFMRAFEAELAKEKEKLEKEGGFVEQRKPTGRAEEAKV